ncbi:MAG: hypothetical protein KKE83_06975 [Proteobacteria bacterium]|nr:hypothetical protein [Pseudomonadota bacterium]
MATYLNTAKIQDLRRLVLGEAALRNLGVDVGDRVEIHFDEKLGCLLVSPVKNEDSGIASEPPSSTGQKKKKR